MLLNLGAVGLVLFLVLFLVTAYKIIQKIRTAGSWEYIFTLVILVYVVVGNLAYSFLLEVDHFVWASLIAVALLVYPPRNEAL